MRRTGCRPGVNDIRCKLQSKLAEPYSFLFESAPEQGIAKEIPRTHLKPSQGDPHAPQGAPLAPDQPTKFPLRPAGVAKATQESLTEEQVVKAKLTRASGIFDKEGTQATQKYLEENGLDYTVDWQLSNDSGLVLIDNASGKAVIAYRGTDITSPRDWVTGLNMLGSNEANDPVFINAKSQFERVLNEYGTPSELVGFSRGGTVAMTLGNEFKVPTTTFNPFVNKNLITSSSRDLHTVIRTTTDPVSVGANVGNFNVIQVNPKGNSLNPIANHELNQFLDTTSRTTPAPVDKVQQFVESTGRAQSELITVKEMSQAIREGKSFSEFLNDFSPVDIRDGTLSSRIYDGSNFTSWWKDSGGTFNTAEQVHLASSPKGTTSPTGTTAQHRSEFSRLSPAEQEVKLNEIGDIHAKAIEQFGRMMAPEEQVQQVIEKPSVITEQLSAVSLGSGLLGGYVGNKIVEAVDPNAKLTAQGDEALSGFLGGGLGAAIAGSAVVPGAIAGSAGVLAGVETTRALREAGLGNVGASTLGGAVGGVTASVVGVGVGVGASALAGAEIGSVLAPETFGISVAVGAGVGALAGLASSLWSEIWGEDEPASAPAPEPTITSQQMDAVFVKGSLRKPMYSERNRGQPPPQGQPPPEGQPDVTQTQP